MMGHFEEGSMIRKLGSGKYRLYSRKRDPKTGRRRNLGNLRHARRRAEARARGPVLQARRLANVARSSPIRRKTAARRPAKSKRRWSGAVTRNSNALDLDAKVFTRGSSRQVAASLKRSAERSKRRKASPYQSAMSMLNFYINRAGKNLPARQRAVLQRAKTELRKAFGRA